MSENLYSNAIRTYTGKYIDVFNPDPDMVCIEDIAHALSRMPRFGGHLPEFYSVAQHSVWCARNIGPLYGAYQYALAALMHDAAEAYLTNMRRPIKQRMSYYRKVEDDLMRVIAQKFRIPYPFPTEVEWIDEAALQTEWRCLMLKEEEGGHLYGYDPEVCFLEMFNDLKNNGK